MRVLGDDDRISFNGGVKVKEKPYIHEELMALLRKAGIDTEGIYRLLLESDARSGTEGVIIIHRYKLRNGLPYLDKDTGDAAKAKTETYEVLTLKRGEG